MNEPQLQTYHLLPTVRRDLLFKLRRVADASRHFELGGNSHREHAEVWPANLNGSPDGAAGLCDATGRIFGLMPHPDAFLDPENHPDWIRRRDAEEPGFGLKDAGMGQAIFDRGVQAVVAGRQTLSI